MAATPTENGIAGRKITSWTLPVSSLDDKPKMTAAALKAAFDSNANQVKPALNGLIDDLTGAGGAGNIGAGAINGVSGTTVQAILEALKALIDLRETTANADSKLNTKADKTTVAAMVKSIGFNAQTGVFTITEQGGTVHTIDTVLEKVPMSCKLEGQDFVLTLEDGTEQRVSLAAFLTPNEFTDSDTVKFSVAGSTVTANIKPGSITMAMLENTLYSQLAALKNDAQTAAANAAASAANAEQHKTNAAASQTAAAASMSAAEGQAGLAKSWATGESGLRAGENADNSKYYAEQAANSAVTAGTLAAGASRSAADAANSAEQAVAEATKAKAEADRAKQIVGGDYVTQTELTSHNISTAAHADIRRQISDTQTALTNHNTDETAHADLFSSIFPYVFSEEFSGDIFRDDVGEWRIFADGSGLGFCVEYDADFLFFCLQDGGILIESNWNNRLSRIRLADGSVYIEGSLDMTGGTIKNLPEPTEPNDAATFVTAAGAVNSRLPQVFTVTIPATNADTAGSVAGSFPACTEDETTCIVDAAPAAASWDAFYDCNFRLKSISPTGFTYTVDSNLTSPMTVYITVQDIRWIEI